MWLITANGAINSQMFDGYEVTPSEGRLALSGIVYGDYSKRYTIAEGSYPDLMTLMTEIVTLKEHLDYSSIIGLDGTTLSPIKVPKDILTKYADGLPVSQYKSLSDKLSDTSFGSFFTTEHFPWTV